MSKKPVLWLQAEKAQTSEVSGDFRVAFGKSPVPDVAYPSFSFLSRLSCKGIVTICFCNITLRK